MASLNDGFFPEVWFVSWHNYLDQSNGASISTRSLLLALRKHGWNVETFCGSSFDNKPINDLSCLDAITGTSLLDVRKFQREIPFSLSKVDDNSIQSMIFLPDEGTLQNGNGTKAPTISKEFLSVFRAKLKVHAPDVIITYGGAVCGDKILAIAREFGVKTVVLLQNFSYFSLEYFKHADLVIVPSAYSQMVYRKRLGLSSIAISPLIDEEPFEQCLPYSFSSRPYVLFVNPSPNKGVAWFAGISREMRRERPDIHFLVVEGSSGASLLCNPEWDLPAQGTIFYASNTRFPENFYAQARLIIVPSFFDESFARVVAEAMFSGTPVIASDRGALPETVGDAGQTLSIPSKYTPHHFNLPTSEEVAPWTNSIEYLWDHEDVCLEWSRKGFERANSKWRKEIVLNQYINAFLDLIRK